MILLAVGAVLAAQSLGGPQPADPFAFFTPSVVVTADDRRRLDRGEPVARIVPSEGHEVAVFAAVPLRADADRLVAWTRRVEVMKAGRYVPQVGRFSDPPVLSDLASLTLDDAELDDARSCRPGKCAMKLSAEEMIVLRRAADGAGANWRTAVQEAFRRVVLARIEAYLVHGLAAIPAAADGERRPLRQDAFAALLGHSPFLTMHAPGLRAFLDRFPHAPGAYESFLYWSKEQLAGRPSVTATHVVIARGDGLTAPDVIVATRQIFATHYMTASLGITALVGAPGGGQYLAYLNRSAIDVLGGFWGGLLRLAVERRLKADAPDLLIDLKRRVEGGLPR